MVKSRTVESINERQLQCGETTEESGGGTQIMSDAGAMGRIKAMHDVMEMYLEDGRIDDALKIVKAEPRVIGYDPNICVALTVGLLKAGRAPDARPILEGVLAVPESELVKRLECPLSLVKNMYRESCGTGSPAPPAQEPPNFLLEAENILLRPDMLSMAAGIRPTPRPLRQLFDPGDDGFDAAMNALVALLQGPNGHYRRIAAFAIGQLGFDHPKVFELLEYQRENEKAPDVLKAIDASISTLKRMGGESSQLDRRRAIQQLYGPGTLEPWRPA
jgi:hypothetical protein